MAEFELSNRNVEFTPLVYPAVIVVRKERRKSRQPGFCDGEEISDIGSKNRELTITGVFFQSEKLTFDLLLDESDPLDLISDEHQGEVEVLNGEYRRDGLDAYKYKLEVVSTGVDEGTTARNNGIISAGRSGSTITSTSGSSSSSTSGNITTTESGQQLYTETFIPQILRSR